MRTVWATALYCCSAVFGGDAVIRVDARHPGKPVSKYLNGACIEDVNHEIYGGLYGQMLFGESFQEPPAVEPVRGMRAYGGTWRVENGVIHGTAGPGSKLVGNRDMHCGRGVGVEVLLPGGEPGCAGLIFQVKQPREGADGFSGYEVSLDAHRKKVLLGRHRGDFKLLKEVDYPVAAGRWHDVFVKFDGAGFDVQIDRKSVMKVTDPDPLPAGPLGLRQWQRPASYRGLWRSGVKDDEIGAVEIKAGGPADEVSHRWELTRKGPFDRHSMDAYAPFAGSRSQVADCRTPFGLRTTTLTNRGLNGQGLALIAGRSYQGYVYLRADAASWVGVQLETGDLRTQLAWASFRASAHEWKRYDFTLTPDKSVPDGAFSLRVSGGSVTVGHVFLQPGEWGRYKDLPVRRDVVESLIDQGVTLLRYGGSMVNVPAYRWKNMVGPRERRPPYRGHWYPYSSNGWGIIDFLNLCEAAGFVGIPAFHADESVADMEDFLEYVNGPVSSPWGKRRVADGHPKPYNLRHIQIGNEERVDGTYARKFTKMAEHLWRKDANVILVVGDFNYHHPVTDPMAITGNDSKLTTLQGHRRILQWAKHYNREVWFDVHLLTDNSHELGDVKSLPSFIDALEKLADGAKHKVVVFELNAGNHRQKRALANAIAIGAVARDGRVPVVASANCLQVDGQNDNGWDQGLLFMNPAKVWLQPPGYVTRMISRNIQARVVPAATTGDGGRLDVTATRSEDGKTVVVQVVNPHSTPQGVRLEVAGFAPTKPTAVVEVLAGMPEAANTANKTDNVVPVRSGWRHGLPGGGVVTFEPYSFTVVRLE